MKRILFAIALITLAPQISEACMTRHPLNFERITAADIIIIGRVVKYQAVGSDPRKNNYANFSIRTKEVLRGPPKNLINATWKNSWFRVPESFEENEDYIFALRKTESDQFGPEAAFDSPPKAGAIHVLQENCGRPFMFKSHPVLTNAIKEIFDQKGDAKQEANSFAKVLDMARWDEF